MESCQLKKAKEKVVQRYSRWKEVQLQLQLIVAGGERSAGSVDWHSLSQFPDGSGGRVKEAVVK